ncbi:endoglucanase 9-like [Euphorbia lathyris]|uniref:endoglucanase 9-like n=1 Tax=Euphorbia lathyris TaxID=212925 RepID=UPI00331427DA
MPNSSASSPSTGIDHNPPNYVHSISEAGRLLPSSSQWNSIELDFRLVPKSNSNYDSLPSNFSKSYDYQVVITDKQYFKRFLYISLAIIFLVLAAVLLVHFLAHKNNHHGNSKDLTLALRQALIFFDAQRSGNYPSNSGVNFRGDSGLEDGDSVPGGLVGGFYDSGNNIKFSFPTAYTITLLSWTVIEYHHKYADIGELDHVKDIIKWGTDYLLQLFVQPNSDSAPIVLYSQVGSPDNGTEGENNDISCWQRPEDMRYARPVSSCDATASDLAGEITAALSAASIVFQEDNNYSTKLIEAAQMLFEVSTNNQTVKQGTYTSVETCGGQATRFYNSSSYKDELVWGGTWLYFATGNHNYLRYATDHFSEAVEEEEISDKTLFYWNNKLTANAVLLTRLLYFRDVGFPFEDALHLSSNATRLLICSYLSQETFKKTPGGLILLNPDDDDVGPLQFAATASFLTKLYSDYNKLVPTSGLSCSAGDFSLEMLHNFAKFQVNYILGDNPMKMSYMVGFGNQYPSHVHHRAASIRWDGEPYACEEGDRWLYSKQKNPNIVYGAMVGGPDGSDNFIDDRNLPLFTEPSIASNAGLVAALIALHDPPSISPDSNTINLGIDLDAVFTKIRNPSSPP